MLNIKILESSVGKVIILSNWENSLKIMMGGNGDLYFSPLIKKDNKDDTISFIISEYDSELYPLFNNLYEKIINYEPFDQIEKDLEFDDIFNLQMDSTCDSDHERRKDLFREFPLVSDGTISWFSDDDIKEHASILKIERYPSEIILNFIRSSKEDNFSPFSVCICNSGSYYDPFNSRFMELYNKLTQIDINYHQISISEYTRNLNENCKKLKR